MRLKGNALSVAGLTAVLVTQLSVAREVWAQEAPPAAQTAAPEAPAVASPAAEQQPKRQAEETIMVTGSRIRRSKEVTTPAPVTVIGREQLQASSAITIGNFLGLLPEQGGAQNTNVNNGGDGTTKVSLRGLGENRTLVLVDGKRVVLGGSGADTSVDLNTIPTAMVERVEVLKDGASSLYGSDAIGGVINIITRKRMNGAEASAYATTSQHNDAQVRDINATAGAAGDKGSFMVGAGYYTQDLMYASNRSWAKDALRYNFMSTKIGQSGSGTTPLTRVNGVSLAAADCPTELCQHLRDAFGDGPVNLMYDPTYSGSATLVDGWRRRISTIDFYNYQAVNYLITPSDRTSLFAQGEYRFNDSARFYALTSYVNRQSSYLVAPEPFVSLNAALAVSGQNPYNPFGQDLADVRLRLDKLQGRGNSMDINTYRVVGGFDGTLPEAAGPLSGWFWDVSGNFGRNAGTTTGKGWLNTGTMQYGVGPGYQDADGYHCGTPGAPIGNCTPVNLFAGSGPIDASKNPAMVNSLGLYTGTNYGWNQLLELQGNLSGELVKLAATRPMALAAGASYRSEYGGYTNEPINAIGWNVDAAGSPTVDTSGRFNVTEGYAELSVPIVDQTPGFEDLQLDASLRAFKYSTFGTDFTWKLGAKWSPIRDITARGTYSTGFRAPNVLELYQGLTAGNFESASDPCASAAPPPLCAEKGVTNPQGGSQMPSTNGGNPDLKPEKAKIFTAGAVFEPSFVPNLAITVDYFKLSMSDLIGVAGSAYILNKCYGAGVSPDESLCSLISRQGGNGTVTNVMDTTINFGTLDTSGIDIGGSYSLPTEFGRFALRFDATYLLTFDSTTPDGTVIHAVGNYDGQGAVQASGGNMQPRVKFNAALSYGLEAFSAGLSARYIGGFLECAPEGGVVDGANTGPGLCYQRSGPNGGDKGPYQVLYPVHRVDSYVVFDLVLGYKLDTSAGMTGFTFGVSNLLDQKPSVIYDSFLTYADPMYDFVGRAFYGRIEHKF